MCEEVRVNEVLREVYTRHQVFTTIAYAEFLGTIASAKNMLTRYAKGTMAAPEGALVNALVVLANVVGPDVSEIFTTPCLNEEHYPVVRSVLHFLGLPYEAGRRDSHFTSYLATLRNTERFPRGHSRLHAL